MVLSWSLVVPARDSERDIEHVVRAGWQANAQQVVVVENGSGDATAERAREAGATVITSVPGKGHAVKAGLRYVESFGYDAVVTSDADLWALESDLLKRMAEAAAAAPVRGEWDRPGRAGSLLPPLLEEFGIDTGGISPAALLSGLAGYPMPFPLPLDALPGNYGWDLATALDLLASGRPLRTVPAGSRLHRPGDESHIATMMVDLVQVCATRSRLQDRIRIEKGSYPA